MNKSKLILGTLVVATIAGGIYLSKNEGKSSSQYSSHTDSVQAEHGEKSSHWAGAREYWETLHMNVNTGQVEQADYDAAKKIAMKIPSAKNAMSFNELGPDNIGGRTRAIEIDPTNESIVYAGSVSGGLFKSTNAGNNWSRVQGYDDNVPVTCISSIAITTNGTIYVGAGFNDFSDGCQSCEGIYYSTDDGATFAQVSGTAGRCVNKIIADRSKSNTVYFTAGAGQYLTRVVDGSSASPTLTQISASEGISVQGASGRDIKISPDGQHLIYCASSRVYVSNDGGNSFTEKSGGVSAGNDGLIYASGMNRIESAVSFDKTGAGKYTMYVVMSSSGNWGGAYFSEDNGVSWNKIAPKWVDNPSIPSGQEFNPLNSGGRSPQGNYNLVCTVVPGDPYTMIFGGIDLYRWRKTPASNPVAGQFERVSFWFFNPSSPNYVHADNHRMTWNSQGNLYVGNDGGVSRSIDTSLSIFSVSNKGYNVTQYYGIGYGPNGDAIGGAQDNGTLTTVNIAQGLQFREVMGGDGFDCELSQIQPGAFIGSVYYSDVQRARNYTSGTASVAPPCSGTIGIDCGTFSTFLRLHEDDHDTDTKDSVEYISENSAAIGDTIYYPSSNFEILQQHILTAPYNANDTLVLPDYIQSLFVTGTTGGVYITRDIWRFGKALEYSKIYTTSAASAFEFSKDGNTVWIGTYSGQIIRVTNLDSAYTADELDMDSPDFKLDVQTVSSGTSSIITDISVDATNPNNVAFTAGGSGGSGNIFYSSNAMSATPNFSSKDGNLPAYVAYGCEIILDPNNDVKMVVGTEFGTYVTTSNLSGTPVWAACNDEIGHVPTYDVRQQWRGWDGALGNVKTPGRVYVGTYGRGIWWSDDVAGIKGANTDNGITTTNTLSNISVYPNPLSNDGNIKFTLAEQGNVKIEIYNLQGKMIKKINLNNTVAGNHNLNFNAADFAAGTYLMTFTSGEHKEVKKFIKK